MNAIGSIRNGWKLDQYLQWKAHIVVRIVLQFCFTSYRIHLMTWFFILSLYSSIFNILYEYYHQHKIGRSHMQLLPGTISFLVPIGVNLLTCGGVCVSMMKVVIEGRTGCFHTSSKYFFLDWIHFWQQFILMFVSR